jgi:hypothetical protein
MTKQDRYCFVAMPFRPELNFFFLYLKRHLEERFSLHVERGDAKVLTRPLMDKIREQILRADLIIGDVTGANPNVFYELGLAHASGKPVIFLTQDPPEQAPVDIRPFEFIRYDLGQHEELLARLNNAVRKYSAIGTRRCSRGLVRFSRSSTTIPASLADLRRPKSFRPAS